MATSRKQQELQTKEAEVLGFLLDKASEVQARNGVQRARAITTVTARDELFRAQITDAMRLVFKDRVVVKPYVAKKKIKTQRILNVMLSDLHFGASLDPRELPFKYGPVEEARRLAAICVQVAEYKREHRAETELAIHLIGDVIQNQLHDARDGLPLAEQIAAAMHLLIQAVSFQATQFKKVTVRCTPGNHGRNKSRHETRAVNGKWDSHEVTIYHALQLATKHLPNVHVEIGYKPFYSWTAFNKRGFATHGDTVLKPGYPGAAIQVGSIANQINSYNAAKEYTDLFIVGHVHVGSLTHLPNGAVFMSNGALIPTDSFAQSIGAFSTACGQWCWESVPDFIVGDSRFLIVDERTDKDKSLDKIIKPFLGFV